MGHDLTGSRDIPNLAVPDLAVSTVFSESNRRTPANIYCSIGIFQLPITPLS